MRIVLQRVKSAHVNIERKITASIRHGLLIFLGIETDDAQDDVVWLVRKVCQMRIFSDKDQKMNLTVKDVGGSMLIVSQFTLHASTKKGNRPSFIRSAPPSIAQPLYQSFLEALSTNMDTKVESGQFGADMQISLINDGPVTIFIDSKNKE
ncbi:MAG: D-tyrosyl-tRNA(Tyr) deacylase [Saprospiraceae bacterium]|nr:D-tyrosyl-tRNA(Tyr) deacylase [Saprospiraceae bacterium]